jgi:long-chain acyl-CoA synthetase
MFRRRVAESSDRIAFKYPAYTEPEQWHPMTWTQSQEIVDKLAAGLLSLGLQTEQRVAIASNTRLEWVLIDLAIACAGGATTTIYPSTHADEEKFILTDSGCVFAVVEDVGQLQKLSGDPDLDGQIKKIIMITDDRPLGHDGDDRVVQWNDLLRLGEDKLAEDPQCVDRSIDSINRDSLSTLIYTSGTTGTPKGVELLHRSWTYEGIAIQAEGIVNDDDDLFLWLPLAHVFGRDLLSAQIQNGFCSIVDGRVNRLVQSIGETSPTILVGVPRIFEKVRAAVMTMYPTRGLKGRISRWAFAVGRDSREYRLAGEKMPFGLRTRYAIADKLVYGKLKDKLGGRMKFMVSGSAKLSPQVQEWFYSAGIILVEGYGLTETSAIVSVNMPWDLHIGTIGKPLPGIEAKIASDGELLLRGPIVARGYHNNTSATTEAFEPDGWFHTGDIGEIDADGFMKITDRKKDLLKTSNGKYVAPQKVENAVMANNPYAAQAVVVGEGRKFVSALIVMDADSLASWGNHHGHPDASYEELTQMPEIRRSVDRFIRRTNSKLEHWEKITKYAILPRELSLEAGELTPSLKVRRNTVLEHFKDLVEEIYAENSTIPFVPESSSHRDSRQTEAKTEAAS